MGVFMQLKPNWRVLIRLARYAPPVALLVIMAGLSAAFTVTGRGALPPSGSPSPSSAPGGVAAVQGVATTPPVGTTPSPPPAPTPSPTAAPPKPATPPQPVVRAAPTPVPRTEFATEAQCPGQSNPGAAAAALTCMSSYARVFHGLSNVGSNAALMAAASSKINDMITCGYSHTACGREADYWLGQLGYTGRCSGENIAYGQATPRAVFEGWMKSPGHRANILNPSYRHIGISTGTGTVGRLWVMELGGC